MFYSETFVDSLLTSKIFSSYKNCSQCVMEQVHYLYFYRSKDDTSDSVEGPRFSVHDNGTLEIYSAEKEDSGPYTCFAKNTEGSSAINVMLSVKGKRVFLMLASAPGGWSVSNICVCGRSH